MAANIKKRAPASSNRPAKDDLLRALETSAVIEVAERELKEFAIASSEMYESIVQQNSALLDQLEAQIKDSNERIDEGFEEAESHDPMVSVTTHGLSSALPGSGGKR